MNIYDNYDTNGRKKVKEKTSSLNKKIVLDNTNIKFFLNINKVEEEDCYDNIYGSRIQSKIKGLK